MVRITATMLCLTAMLWSSFASAAQATSDWSYTARPGDNLWDLARRFCGSHQHASELARYNRLADPSALTAGERLKVPVSCLVKQPAAASVVTAGVGATLRREGVDQPISASDPIVMGDVIRTTEGFVVVQFADASLLTIRPQSSVVFVLISAFGETGMVDTLVRVGRGRVQHVVNQGTGGSRHRIATPVGIAAVRGTQYRVSVLSAEGARPAVSTVATTEGEVQFEDAVASKLALPAGTGVVASQSGSVKETLLSAPVLLLEPVQSVGAPIAWRAVDGATAYRLTVRQNDVPVLDLVTNDTQATLELGSGNFAVSVRAIASSGLEGLDANATVEFAIPPPKQLQHSFAADGGVRLSWLGGGTGPYVVQVKRTNAHTWQRFDVIEPHVIVTLDPGRYEWRVAAADKRYGQLGQFEIAPAPVLALSATRESHAVPLVVTWEHPRAAAKDTLFQLQISNRADFTTIESAVSAEGVSTAIDLPNCRRCYLRVSAQTAGVSSDYTTTEFVDKPGHSWPLYLILLAALAAL